MTIGTFGCLFGIKFWLDPNTPSSLVKLKHNVNFRLIDDEELRWLSRANDCADRAAKRVVNSFLGNRFRTFERKYNDFNENVQRLSDFYSLWAEVNHKCWVKGKQQTCGNECNPGHELLHNPTRCVSLSCQISDSDFEGNPFGAIFVRRVLDYFQGLQWDFEADNVSILELYFDFAIWTQSYVPILLHIGAKGPKGPVKTFVLKDQATIADIQDNKKNWVLNPSLGIESSNGCLGCGMIVLLVMVLCLCVLCTVMDIVFHI